MLAITPWARGQAGALDPDFAPMFTTEGGFSLAVPAPGGKVLVAGSFHFVNGAARRGVALMNEDGSVDAQGVPQFSLRENMDVFSVGALPDGRVAVCSGPSGTVNFDLGPDNGTQLTILKSDGTVESQILPSASDSQFGYYATRITRVAASDRAFFYVMATSERIGVAGPSTLTLSVHGIGLMTVTGLAPSFNGSISGLVPFADGSVTVWGRFTSTNTGVNVSGLRPGLARLKPDLTLDPWVPMGLPAGSVIAAAAGPGGTTLVAVAGLVVGGNQVQVLRLLADGSVDPSFAAIQFPVFPQISNNLFRRMSALADGSVTIEFSSAVTVPTTAGSLSAHLLRYDATGALDEAWTRAAVTVGASDYFLISGNGRALIPQTSVGNSLRPKLRWLETDGSAGASFAEASRTGAISAVAIRSDGAIVASRDGLFLSTNPPYTAINGAPWTKTALIREDGSLDPGFGYETSSTSGGGLGILPATALHFDDHDRLVVRGSFTHFNGVPRGGIARLNAAGTTDGNFLPEIPAKFSIFDWAFRPDGRIFLVSNPTGLQRTRAFVSLLDDGRKEDLAENQIDLFFPPIAPVSGLFLHRIFELPDGDFAAVLKNVPQIRGDGSSPHYLLSWKGHGFQTIDEISHVALQADGKLIVAGDFTSRQTSPADIPCNRVIRLNSDGTIDPTFDTGYVDAAVRQVAVLSDGRIEIIGDFSSVNGQPRTGLARLLPGPGPLPPSQPAALSVVRISDSRTQLSWADVRNELGYRVERRGNADETWAPIGTVDANVTQFFDNDFASGARYRIIALGANGDSHPSAAAAAPKPRTPRNVTATAISVSSIRLSWENVSGETGYGIDRSADGLTNWATIATVSGDITTIDITGLPPQTQRFFRVSSSNFDGTSAWSDVVSATTSPAIYLEARGNWTGIVTPFGDFAHKDSGSLGLAVNVRGEFTGTLTLGAKRGAVRGHFSADGIASGQITEFDGIVDWSDLSLSRDGTGTGFLRLGGEPVASVRFVRSRVWTAAAPCPYRGAYTLLLPPDSGDAAAPRGVGFGRAVVSNTGTVEFIGNLPDGTVFSHGARISADGEWPLLGWLYRGSGALLGWMRFADDGRVSSTSPARWEKPALARGAVHREAFVTAIAASGARYSAQRPVFSTTGPMQIVFGGSDVPSLSAAITVGLTDKNTITAPGGSGLTMTLSTATGLFSGTFIPPGEHKAVRFLGAIVQPDLRGAGFFRGLAKSGSVLFE